MAQYICYNGNFLNDSETCLSHRNRAFCYGDAFFETMRCLGTEPFFYERHWERITRSMKQLHMEWGSSLSAEGLKQYIEKLLNKNRIFKGARVRITFFRNEGGLYTPQDNTISWIMQSDALDAEYYELNKRGLHVDLFDEALKPALLLSNLKTANALVSVLAGIYRKEQQLDECLILNQYGRIAESLSSNIFIVKEKQLLTPPLTEGCLAGTMRATLMELAKHAGYELIQMPLTEKQLFEADEVFLTNAVQGIQWVGAYKDKRYFNFAARKLIQELIAKAKQDSSASK